MVVVYQHKRLDTNDIFYIGIGNKKRPYQIRSRNKHWKNIVKKHGYEVEILFTDLNWQEACDIEKYLIKYYGRKDLKLGKLVNMTDGGNGSINRIVSKEERLRISKLFKGKTQNEEWIYKRSKSLKLFYKNNINAFDIIKLKNSKKIIDIETNIIYNSITEVSKIFKINRTTLNAKLSGQNKNNTSFKYLETYEQI